MNLKKMNLNKLDKKLNFLTKNKVVFFALMFVIVLALFNYIYNNNYYAVVVFVVSCVVLSYFSKNKLVIMLLSLILTKLLVHLKSKKEGFKEGAEKEEEEEEENFQDEGFKEEHENEAKPHPPLKPSKVAQNNLDASSINEKETKKAGFTNLQENMEHDEQKDLSEAMANIMDSHDAMSKNMVGLAPMMKQAQELTEKLTKGGMGKLLAKASSYADKLGK